MLGSQSARLCTVLFSFAFIAVGCEQTSSDALFQAFQSKNKQTYQYLLGNGADPNVVNSRGVGVMNLSAYEAVLGREVCSVMVLVNDVAR